MPTKHRIIVNTAAAALLLAATPGARAAQTPAAPAGNARGGAALDRSNLVTKEELARTIREGDFATKADVASLRADLEALRARLAALRTQITGIGGRLGAAERRLPSRGARPASEPTAPPDAAPAPR